MFICKLLYDWFQCTRKRIRYISSTCGCNANIFKQWIRLERWIGIHFDTPIACAISHRIFYIGVLYIWTYGYSNGLPIIPQINTEIEFQSSHKSLNVSKGFQVFPWYLALTLHVLVLPKVINNVLFPLYVRKFKASKGLEIMCIVTCYSGVR